MCTYLDNSWYGVQCRQPYRQGRRLPIAEVTLLLPWVFPPEDQDFGCHGTGTMLMSLRTGWLAGGAAVAKEHTRPAISFLSMGLGRARL